MSGLILVYTGNGKGKTTTAIGLSYAAPEIMEIADTVTEMTEKRHAYNQGVEAKAGMEF